jgi:hypothetical protein
VQLDDPLVEVGELVEVDVPAELVRRGLTLDLAEAFDLAAERTGRGARGERRWRKARDGREVGSVRSERSEMRRRRGSRSRRGRGTVDNAISL